MSSNRNGEKPSCSPCLPTSSSSELFSEIYLEELEIPCSKARVLKDRDCIFLTELAEENNLGKVQKLK